MSVSWKNINKIALPAIVSSIAEPLITLGDQVIIGQSTHAAVALSAVGSAGILLSALIWVLSQSKSSISSIVSNALGQGDASTTNQLINNVFLFNLILATICIAFTLGFTETILHLVKTPTLSFDAAAEYLKIRIWGLPLTLLTFMIFGIFRGLQNTSYAMLISISAGVLNILLDAFFILYLDWEVAGAAYASLIAQGLMFIASLFLLMRKSFFQWQWTIKKAPQFKHYFNLTINFILRTVALNVALFLGQRYANEIGLEIGAVYSILMNIWLFCAFFLDGYGHAGNAIGGKLYGAKDYKSLLALGKKVALAELACASFLIICLFLGQSWIAKGMTQDKTIQELLYAHLYLVIFIQWVNGLAFGFDGIYKGMGKAKLLRNLLVVSSFLFFIPILLLLNYQESSLEKIFIAFYIWMAIRAFYLMYDFFFKTNRNKLGQMKKLRNE